MVAAVDLSFVRIQSGQASQRFGRQFLGDALGRGGGSDALPIEPRIDGDHHCDRTTDLPNQRQKGLQVCLAGDGQTELVQLGGEGGDPRGLTEIDQRVRDKDLSYAAS